MQILAQVHTAVKLEARILRQDPFFSQVWE